MCLLRKYNVVMDCGQSIADLNTFVFKIIKTCYMINIILKSEIVSDFI